MAGTIPLSLTQQFDEDGAPLNGGFLYFYAAGTTTPQSPYSDQNLTIELSNPLELDSAGRVPQFFLADGNIKIRLTDADGVTKLAADNILVIGPSAGEGGGDSVDATTIFATGDLKARYGTGALSGWVRAAGRTIGSSTSGASERANADTQSLFEYLWTNDSNLSVSGGRGASANADWVANKTIALPDWRGRAMAFLDDMGNSAAGKLTASYFGTSATVLGADGGSESHTLTIAQLAAHNHTGSTVAVSQGTVVTAVSINSESGMGAGSSQYARGATSNSLTATPTIASQGGDGAHNNTQPTRLATLYIKL